LILVKYLCEGDLNVSDWEDVFCIKGGYPSFTFYHRGVNDGIEGFRVGDDGWVHAVTTTPLSTASVKAAIEKYIGTEIELIETGESIAV